MSYSFSLATNGHTDHCYVIAFAAGKRLDVIITMTKTVQYSVSCPPGMKKVGTEIFSLAPLAILTPTFKTVAPPLSVVGTKSVKTSLNVNYKS